MSSSDDQPLECTGIAAYDLEPPGGFPRIEWAPLRHPGRVAPHPRYVPPPLPEGFARVELDDDYYLGPQWSDWFSKEHEYPARVFDVPAEQRNRWQQAQEAYQAMQEEIDALRASRAGRIPEGWKLKPPYQVQP